MIQIVHLIVVLFPRGFRYRALIGGPRAGVVRLGLRAAAADGAGLRKRGSNMMIIR